MYGFYLKKNFCDGWDNVGQLIVVNLVILAYGLLSFVLLAIISPINSALGMISMILLWGVGMILIMAFGENAYSIAKFEGLSLKDYFKAIPSCAKDGFLFGALCGILFCAVSVGIPSYLSMKNIFGFMLAVILFWIGFIAFLSLQWFIPLRSIMHDNFKKCLRKCFVIFFDNTFFSIFVGIYTLLMLPLSIFLFFLVPSAAGILLAQTNALRLRLYKYDFLEQHPELKTRADQSDIPWDELIVEDKESLGPRRLRSFLFPWKD